MILVFFFMCRLRFEEPRLSEPSAAEDSHSGRPTWVQLYRVCSILTRGCEEEAPMTEREITARVYRYDPSEDDGATYREYRVPLIPGSSAMNVLDYIYQNLDGSLAYYDHAGCALGICARCTGRVNGKLGLLCQVFVEGDVTIEPMSEEGVTRDLVVVKTKKGAQSAPKTGGAG
jgi:hypothetical protein